MVALVRSPAAIDEDCRRADVLITTEMVFGACPRPRLVIDGRTLRRTGSHALWLADGTIRDRAAGGGTRPWSGTGGLSASGRSESTRPAAPAP